MAFHTETEIESTIKRVFPAAEVLYYERWADIDSDPLVDVSPGRWIDRLGEQLDLEQGHEEDASYVVAVRARLNAVLGVDSHGRRVWVPSDHVDRYGQHAVSEEDNRDDYDPLEDAPIDFVPHDDRTNAEWALDVIHGAFPEAEITVDDSGDVVLDTGLHLVDVDDSGRAPFSADLDFLWGQSDEEIKRHAEIYGEGETVWEREAFRAERLGELRSLARALTRQTPRTLSPEDRLLGVESKLEQRDLLEEDERVVLEDARRMLRAASERSLDAVLSEGESKIVEYKLTALAAYPEGDRSDRAADELIRTVAALMNSEGGVLVIGVHDSGRAIGIEADLVRAKGSHDVLHRNVLNKLCAAIGTAPVSEYVSIDFEGEPTLLTVRVQPAHRHVYAGIRGDEKFCIRVGPSTRALKHSEANEYIELHWGRGASELRPDDSDQ